MSCSGRPSDLKFSPNVFIKPQMRTKKVFRKIIHPRGLWQKTNFSQIITKTLRPKRTINITFGSLICIKPLKWVTYKEKFLNRLNAKNNLFSINYKKSPKVYITITFGSDLS